MWFRLLSVLWMLLAASAVSARPSPGRGVVSGVVTDAETGEVLIGATVFAPSLGRGAATNAYGFFSLPVPADSVRLRVSYVGYQPADLAVDARTDVRVDVALRAESALGEVVVEAGDVGGVVRCEAWSPTEWRDSAW